MHEVVRSTLTGERRPLGWVLGLCTGIALAACTHMGEPPSADRFPESAARELFADGYRHVRERYIEPVQMDDLALAGLDGFAQMATELDVRSDGGRVSLIENGHLVRAFDQPDSNDTGAWASLTAAVLRTGWTTSAALREMPAEDIYTSVFTGMLTELDDYSRYTDAESSRRARAHRDGFGGVGITVGTVDGQTTIMRVLPESPASRAGLKAEDRIVAIGGESMVGQSHGAVAQHLRGLEGTELTLVVHRGTPPRAITVSMVREHIVPQTVWYRREGDVAYFRLTSFNRQTTSDLSRLIEEAQAEIGPGMAGIVLDLRGNPGGLLDQAIGVADLFLRQGTIISTRGRHPASNSAFTAMEGDIAEGLPIVVLINGRSASAAEILAAALQDQGRAVVVGSSSHGKGSVQNVGLMPNGGELIITWSRLLAPSGYMLDRLGVMPSLCTSGGPGSAEARKAGPGAIVQTSTVRAWHDYAVPDEETARTLRLRCPAVGNEPPADVQLADRMLHDARFYAKALRPWAETVTASRAWSH